MKLYGLLCLLLISSLAAESLHRIDFRSGDLRTNLDRALDEEKLVFVDLSASWCHSCRLMEETTFRDSEIISVLNEHYVSIKVDADQVQGKLLAAQENIRTLPALLVMDARGNRLSMINKAPTQEALLRMLKSNL